MIADYSKLITEAFYVGFPNHTEKQLKRLKKDDLVKYILHLHERAIESKKQESQQSPALEYEKGKVLRLKAYIADLLMSKRDDRYDEDYDEDEKHGDDYS